MAGSIRIGVGGWTFEPWRGVFYPKTVKQKDELAYASRHLTAIEINGTYYSTFKPDSWKKWRDETPDGFVFAVKGSRFTTNRRELAGAGRVAGALSSPRAWPSSATGWARSSGSCRTPRSSTRPTSARLLPAAAEGAERDPLRHALEPRHDSFCTPAYPALLRKHGIANVYAKHGRYPEIADLATDFVYARLQTGDDAVRDRLSAGRARQLGGAAEDLGRRAARRRACRSSTRRTPPPKTPRDVFAFIIHEGKIRAPAGAMALIERCK